MKASLLALAFVLLNAAHAYADPLPPRETARVGERWQYNVGVFNPLTLGLGSRVEVRTHPLLFFVAPNAVLRVSHVRGPVSITGEYGFSIPTLGMRLLQGYLFPSWDKSDRTIGWSIVPRVGAVATWGLDTPDVVSASADVAFGVPFSHSDAAPLGAPAPIEVLFAPALSGYRLRVGAVYDRALLPWLRARATVDGYYYGIDDGPTLSTCVGLAVDVAVGRMSRFTLGAVWWNSNQHERDEESQRPMRSNDFYPTLDFIWSG